MSFGRVVNGTQLGQPLDFSAYVRLDADESLARECVFADVASGDTRIPPALVRVSVVSPPGDAERVVRVSTSSPIDEPVVTVNVTIGCTSKVTRQFVAFVDPPGLAPTPLAGALPTGPLAGAAAVAGDAVPRRGQVVADTPAPARPADPRTAAGRVSLPPEPVRKPVPAVRAAAPAGPRLQLDAPSVAVAAVPVAAATAPPPSPAAALAASAADAQAEALARERKRIQALEDEITAMRTEAKVQREALAALQLRVGSRPSQRYANPLVYTLAALCLLLTTTVCALLGRRSRDRSAARWLTSAMLARSIEPARPRAAAPEALPAPNPEVPAESPSSVAVVAAPVAAAVVPASPRDVAGVRSQSVEELIDLEQQADFFVVLGQDDAAIELLRGHVAGDNGAASPMPLLKLLELHQRVGDRAEYDRVRSRIDRHFNARTPVFDADPVPGRALEDHPAVLARLQAAWPTPSQALDTLDALVFRRRTADEAFDLPAFRELMFLRSVAADHVGRGGVGVELLSSAESGLPATVRGGSAPKRENAGSRSVDVDLTRAPVRPTAMPPPGQRLPVLTATAPAFDGTETVPSALRRAPGFANESAFVDLEIDLPALGVAARPGG